MLRRTLVGHHKAEVYAYAINNILKNDGDIICMSDTATKEKQDKAFKQILTIAREAGLLIFMTDEEDETYTDRVLIERPVDEEDEAIFDKVILTNDEAETAKELHEAGMRPKAIVEVVLEEREEH